MSQSYLYQSPTITGTLTIQDLGTVLNTTWDARSQWLAVGLGLGISMHTLNAIKIDHHGVSGDCYSNVLVEWLRRGDPSPTWRALAEALKSHLVGMSDLAEQLPP